MEVIGNPSIEFWEEVVSKCECATFYHTYLWSKVLAEAYPIYEVCPKGFIFDDGTKALIPILRSKSKGFFKQRHRLKSLPFGFYGGPIYTGSWSDEKNKELYSYFNSRKISFHIESNPFFGYDLPDYFHKSQVATYVIRLDRSVDELWKQLSSGHRKSVKKALKMGVKVRKATSREEYEAYYNVYQDTLKRWGDNTIISYPHSFFLKLLESQYDFVTLWLAELGDKIIAGIIMLYWNKVAYAWHGCSLASFAKYHPNNLLNWSMIQDALNKNYQFYDFGPSGKLKGVEDFKRHFGAERILFTRGHLRV